MADKDFKVKRGLEVQDNALVRGNIQVVSSTGVVSDLVDSNNNIVVVSNIRGPSTLVIDPAAHDSNSGTVRILGNLQVEGTTTTINSATVSLNDKNLVLADSAANAAAADGAGITINGANATLTYNAAGDKFVFNKPIETSALTGNITGTVSSIANHSTDDLSEGSSNLYYTDGRVATAIPTTVTSSYVQARADSDYIKTAADSDYIKTAITASYIQANQTPSDVVSDTTPQLGGNLDLNSKNITGTGNIDITGTSAVSGLNTLGGAQFTGNITPTTGAGVEIFAPNSSTGQVQAFNRGGAAFNKLIVKGDPVEIYDGSTKRIETTGSGVTVSGTLTATSFSGDGSNLTNLPTGGLLSNIVEDTTPQLGGNLDLNSKNITGTGKIQITGNIELPDNYEVRLGTGLDLTFAHYGGNSEIRNRTGELKILGDNIKIRNDANSEVYISAVNNGAVELYHNNIKKLETTSGGTTVTGTVTATAFSGDGSNLTGLNIVTDTSPQLGGDLASNGNNINIADGDFIKVGTGNDLEIYHQSNVSYLKSTNTAAPIRLQAPAGEIMANFAPNAGVEIYYDGTKKFETTSAGATVTGTLNADTFSLADNAKINVGAGNDLQIYHDGSHSRIEDVGTGYLIIKSSEVQIQSSNGEDMAKFEPDGAVRLYHDNIEKITTTSGGATVAGNIVVSGTVDGRDIATDGTKLDGIDVSATANPITGAQADRIITSGGGKALTAQADFQFDGTNLFIPAEMRHLGDPDTKLGFTTDTITLTAGGVAAQTITATSTTIAGNLIVNGTTTTINSSTLDVDDLNITVAKGAGSAAAANGAGLTVDGASATLLYQNTGDKWVFNKPLEATSFTGNVTSTSVNIDGGAIDGTNIGATTPGTGAFTTLTGNTIGGFSHLSAVGGGSTVEIVVTVASKTAAHRYNGSGSGLGYVLDGVQAPYLTLTPGRTYRFKQDDGSNSGHPFRFYYDAAKTTAYTTNVTTNLSAGQTGSYTQIVVDENTPAVLHYQCSAHGLMGNAARMGTRNFTGFTTDNVTEGSTNLYYTDARVQAVSINNVVEDTSPSLGGTLDANGNTIDMGTNVLSDTNLGQFITAYGWGNHASVGYLTGITGQSINQLSDVNTAGIATGNILKWNGSAFTAQADAGGLDSALITQLVDSAYVQSRQTSGGGGGGSLSIKDEGSALSSAATTLNFVGAGVVASGTGAEKTITISGGGSGITVQDEGSSLSTVGTTLNFVGSGVTASGTGSTKTITISGGGGGGGSGTVDSAATITLIQSTVDSAYVQARQTSGGGGGASGVDSAAVTALINNAYIQTRVDLVDSSEILNLVDSDYIQSRILGINASKITEFKYIADSGQTVFSGNDENGNPLAITASNHEVYLNGIRLLNADFATDASANSVTLAQGLDSADELVIVTQGSVTTNDRFVVGAGTQRFFYNTDSGQSLFFGNDKHGNSLTFDSGQIDVYLNGILLTNDDFHGNAVTNRLHLSSPADSGDDLAVIAYNATLAAEFTAGTGTLNTFKFTLSNAQTLVEGGDQKGNTLAYIPGNELVFLNGLLLQDSDDYARTSTTVITLTTGANPGDELVIQDYSSKFSGNTAGIINPEFKEFKYIADSGDATFSGADANGNTLSLTTANQEVFLNGIRLLASDYTANTSTNTITLNGFTAVDSDEIVISTLVGNVRFNGAQTVSQIVDSAYIAARTEAGTDSSTVLALIQNTVNGAYVQARQVDAVRDSAFITGLIDSAYINARVSTVDSAQVLGIVDSDYINLVTGIGQRDVDFGTNKILYSNNYANLAALPSASTYHGMFAHVHGQGKAYYAHAGNWVQLADKSETLDSYYTSALIDSAYVNSKFDGTVDPKFTDFLFTVDSGTTTITGLSDAGDSLSIGTNNFAVFLNGIKLQDIDFTDSSANNRITLNNPLDSADEILVQTVTSTRTSSLPAILGTVDSAYIQQRLTEMTPATSTFSTFRYVATEGQRLYTGNDANGNSLSIDSNAVQVFANGLLLTRNEDFVDSTTTNRLTLLDSINAGSEIVINNYATSFRAKQISTEVVTEIVDSDYVQARALGGQTYNATSSNITLAKANAYIVDTSSARTLTLPATATLGDEIKIIDGTGQANTNNITINRNGHKIQGLTDNLVINISRAATGLVYYNAAQGWILTEN
tara:strand:+ start:31514 stop:37990 length:6477 start_codon:yes stop_codon:yes gene_type:complete